MSNIIGFDFDLKRFISLSDEQKEIIKCCICLSAPQRPVLTTCRHNFCFDCINEALISHQYRCPECRTYLGGNATAFVENRVLAELMSTFDIECNLKSDGCEAVFALKDWSKHLEECDFNLCNECGFKRGNCTEHNYFENLKKKLESMAAKTGHKLRSDLVIISDVIKFLEPIFSTLSESQWRQVLTIFLIRSDQQKEKLFPPEKQIIRAEYILPNNAIIHLQIDNYLTFSKLSSFLGQKN